MTLFHSWWLRYDWKHKDGHFCLTLFLRMELSARWRRRWDGREVTPSLSSLSAYLGDAWQPFCVKRSGRKSVSHGKGEWHSLRLQTVNTGTLKYVLLSWLAAASGGDLTFTLQSTCGSGFVKQIKDNTHTHAMFSLVWATKGDDLSRVFSKNRSQACSFFCFHLHDCFSSHRH